jgi:antitoxin component YwqK of YwqJK toxin-antitoxin module
MMRPVRYFAIALLAAACTNNEQRTLSEREMAIQDSLSKVQQRRSADSLKKTNPLLIVPPDSSYTGSYVDKYPTGITKFTGFFRFGQRHGQWMSFYPNGELWSEMHYDKGLRHGPNKAYFENGKLRYEGFYKNDEQDSVWNYYDTLGAVAEKVLYKNNRIIRKLPLK